MQISSVKFSNDNSNHEDIAIQFDADELYGYMRALAKGGVDVMIHTSHDLSVHGALDAISRVKDSYEDSKSRFTLAHVNMVRDSDFKRFKELNIIANIQPFNAKGGGYFEYIYMLYDDWEDKLARYKTFYDEGIVVSASSDFPVCSSSLDDCTPFQHMQIALTRQEASLDEKALVLPNINERVSIEQIIKAYTINAAYQLHVEDKIGSLEVGKRADLIVLNQNLLTVQPKKIYQTLVTMTMLNGEIVYEKK